MNEEAITLPDMSWTVIRAGRHPGDIYIKTKFGYWLEAKTGKDISDADLTVLVNEKVVLFDPNYRYAPRGYKVLEVSA